jgi:hypothetical protein
MRPTTRKFLAKLNVLQALAAVVSFVLAYLSPDVTEGPDYLGRACIFYSLFVVAGIIIALWIYLERADQAQSPSTVTSGRHSSRLRPASFDDDLPLGSSESFASTSRSAPSYESATTESLFSSPPTSYTYGPSRPSG